MGGRDGPAGSQDWCHRTGRPAGSARDLPPEVSRRCDCYPTTSPVTARLISTAYVTPGSLSRRTAGGQAVHQFLARRRTGVSPGEVWVSICRVWARLSVFAVVRGPDRRAADEHTRRPEGKGIWVISVLLCGGHAGPRPCGPVDTPLSRSFALPRPALELLAGMRWMPRPGRVGATGTQQARMAGL